MGKPLNVDLPYPSLDGIRPNLKQAEIIAPAYASASGELNAILQYVYHNMWFEKEGMEEYSTIYQEIFVSEMHHLDLLGDALIRLGVDPVFTAQPPLRKNFFSTAFVDYSTRPRQMLLADIAAETQAISGYTEMITRLGDAPIAELVRRIRLDEELHLKTFKAMYKELSC